MPDRDDPRTAGSKGVERPQAGARPGGPARAGNSPGTETSRQAADPTSPGEAETGKDKRAIDLLPTVALPKGGGAIRGLGEKFSVNAATGTAGLAIPLPLSPGRAGFTPALQLGYDSGAGNGPFGFGWSLDTPAITRKTDKGLPRYADGDESDVYIMSGAEDLVPIRDNSGARKHVPRVIFGKKHKVFFYRPRIEGMFTRIERWVADAGDNVFWRSLSRTNVATLYGYDADSRVADPSAPTKIFSWHICRTWDDRGNAAVYRYTSENSAGIATSSAHETNRTAQSRSAQIYLDTIHYGNLQPYRPDWSAASETPLPDTWLFAVVLDYANHSASPPRPQGDQPWPARPDPFSTYRAGFEIRTYRRVQRLLFFNNFPDESSAGPDCLVRSLDLVYSDQEASADPRNPVYTFLVSASQTGWRRSDSGPIGRSLPPLEFAYSQPQFQPAIQRLDRDSLGNLPEGIDGTRFRWVDLDGEGLSGILSEAPSGWYYKRNRSANNLVAEPGGSVVARASFGALETVAALPSHADLAGGLRLLDLAGSGRLDVVELNDRDPGYFKRSTDGGFEPFHRFGLLPQIDWNDPNVKFVDVTGDGLADILVTEDGVYTFYRSLGEAGFDTAALVRPPWDEEKGPAVVFVDGTDTIFIADMSGGGLNDIVRVRNGETCYWPNIGYGRFGAKVTMDHSPRFESEDRFDPARLRLADIDGTGSADLLYVAEDGVRAWFNQSGNAWSAPTTIAVFPAADRLSSVQALDLLGTGTACLVWSSPLPGETAAPMLYVDLMGGQKPHLLVTSRNNLGAETRVAYAPSTRFYLDDQVAGRPWVTRLPFPVQVVERVETFDWIGRNRLVSRYAYHHGYFDGYEREFRGFGMVEQWDTEEFRDSLDFNNGEFLNWDQQSWSPPVLTRTWFHTGAFEEAPAVTQQYLGEYWTEPALRPAARAADAAAMRLPDTVLPDGLDPYEIQEAYRALRGRALRIEVYAQDGSAAAGNPYTVTEQNFTVECLQHRGTNLHAIFFVHSRETITFHYERAAGDPRVQHDLTLEVDPYGNVTRAVSIGYPRRTGYPPPEPAMPAAIQGMLGYDQTRLHISSSERHYTNPIDDPIAFPDSYVTPLLAASATAEITGVAPSVKGSGITNLFSFAEIDGSGGNPGIWQTAWTGAHDIPYEAIPAADVDGVGTAATSLTRRFLAQNRVLYRRDDLTALLPPGQLQSRALPGESYTEALTPGLVSAIFGALVPPATLSEGGYVQLAGETGWWIPSGSSFYSAGDADTPAQELANAIAHFFVPRRATDPFGAVSRADYDGYDLLPVALTDRVGNIVSAVHDYRVLLPILVTDPNGNRGAAAFDALGTVTATAAMGKTGETQGDLLTGFVTDLDEAAIVAAFADPLADPAGLLGNASLRTIYDLNAYRRTSAAAQPSPPAVYSLTRETHVADLGVGGAPAATGYQFGFGYSDGFGREIQHKARIAPGPIVDGGPPVSPRWAGSGWTIFNNKGAPVRQYEPFFSTTNGFEFAAQKGVSTVLLYDAAGRKVAVLAPDNSWGKTVLDAWRQDTWDRNDTTLIADPRNDGDVGGYFRRCLGTTAFTSWRDLRGGGHFGANADERAAQKDAADKAAAHAATPAVVHFDALARTCLAVSDNGGGNRFASRTAQDTEGRPLAVIDALGRRAEEYFLRAPRPGGGVQYIAGSDMADNPLYQINADSGARRALGNVAGNLIRSWDARGHAFRMVYDPAQRMKRRFVSIDGAAEILIDLSIYGEGMPAANLCGRLFRHYDTAGYVENSRYDFKGNPLAGARQLAVAYRQSIDWSPLAVAADMPQPDAALRGAALDSTAIAAGLIPTGDGGRDRFASTTAFDALNRPVQAVAPHNATMKPDVRRPAYDDGGRLIRVDAWLQQSAAPTVLLDPTTADRHATTAITYNARGQRASIAFGNGTTTAYEYDAQTFRLTRLTTTRPGSFPADEQTVQALAYFYDPVGNVTRIRDSADIQNVIYFRNRRVEPSSDYTYDPIYRLTKAAGREHLGQSGGGLSTPQQVSNDDSPRCRLPQPGDGTAMGNYTETYAYDPVGNLMTVGHQVTSGNWTRRYSYNEASQIIAAERGNRLSATSLPGDPAAGPFSATYAYDSHGNLLQMPHLPRLNWDEDERLRSTARQVVNAGSPETSFYVYGSSGQRVRKLIDRQAGAGQAAVRRAERIYLGGVELYREYDTDGMTVTLERETLHIDAGDHPVAFVETRTFGTDPAPPRLVRYQFANHLGSAALELGDQADVISYEEYFPFGSTSYQAVTNQTDTPKRYRHTDKERDEENDFYYHGARYYAPWLGRWTACDPAGLADGTNLYAYCQNRPINLKDPSGTQGRAATAAEKATLAERGITNPAIVRGLVNIRRPRAPKVGGTGDGAGQGGHGHGTGPHGGAGHGGAGKGGPGAGGAKGGGKEPGGAGPPGSQGPGGPGGQGPGGPGGGQPGGTGDKSQPGVENGSPYGQTVNGSGVRQDGAIRKEGVGGTGKGPADPNAVPLDEMDYATLLASLLAPIHSDETSKDGVSGGIPGGTGPKWMASHGLQAVYIGINLAFTFLGEQIESGLRKIGSAIKSGLAKVWAKIGPAVLDAVMAPVFMAVGAGGLGGGSGRLLSSARRAARSSAIRDALASLRAGNPTPQAAHLAEQLEAIYGREALVEFMETGKLPKGVEFSHLFSAAEYPEFAHQGDLGVLTDSGTHRAGHHGGDTRVPLHGFPRIPGED